MSEHNDWNQKVIDAFRANDGKVGGMFEGAPLLLLHTTGARTGLDRVHPLMYQQVGDELAVFASNAGGPRHPDWYFNLLADPDGEIETGSETVGGRARVAEGEERDRIWEAQKEHFLNFAEHELTTEGREIPVVLLSRSG